MLSCTIIINAFFSEFKNYIIYPLKITWQTSHRIDQIADTGVGDSVVSAHRLSRETATKGRIGWTSVRDPQYRCSGPIPAISVVPYRTGRRVAAISPVADRLLSYVHATTVSAGPVAAIGR